MAMALRNPNRARQEAGESDDWLPIDEAAALIGDPPRTVRWRARAQWVRAGLAKLAPPRNGQGRPTWWVHRGADHRLARCPTRDTRDQRLRDALSATHPAHLVDRALRKNHWLQAWRSACEQARPAGVTDGDLAARIVDAARQSEQDGFAISVRSLYGWWRRYNQVGADGQIQAVAGLIDRYASGELGESSANRSPDAVDWFYDLYHTQNKLSIRTCHEVTLCEARRRDWTWPAGYAATVAWLAKYDDLSLTCLMREGKDRWARRYLPHLQIDYSAIEPGYMYVCDHHQLDLWCDYNGTQIRPWLTAVEDCRSRCIVGWHLGPAPHQDAILSSLRMAFRDWAVPTVMRIDNGRDYTSRLITGPTKRQRDGLLRAFGADWRTVVKRAAHVVDCVDPRWLGLAGELDIDLIYAIPYSPWSKMIERFFGTFTDQHAKCYPTYCGNSAVNKPECLHEIRRGYTDEQKRRLRKLHGRDWKRIAVLKLVDQSAVPALDHVRTRIAEWLDIYHRTGHRGQAMEGRTPLAVWGTATHLRRAVDNELLCLADIRGLYSVGANGVSLKVGAATLYYGAKCAALKRWVGRRVLVALNPQDISVAWALTPDRDKRTLIGRLEPNQFIEPRTTADDARDVIAESMRERSIMHKARRAAPHRIKTVSARLAEHARAKRSALMATGTDDAVAAPAIVPVRTGFDVAAIPERTAYEPVVERHGDALQRMAEFVKRADGGENQPASTWSRLQAFVGRESPADD